MERFLSSDLDALGRKGVDGWSDGEWALVHADLELIKKDALKRVSIEYLDEVVRLASGVQRGEVATKSVELLLNIAMLHFYSGGQPRDAILPVRIAVKILESFVDAPLRRKALTLYGIVCADTADTGMAVQCYDEALHLAKELGDLQAQCVVWINLGSAYMVSAAYEDALVSFGQAIALGSVSTDPVLIHVQQSARANIALAYLHLERPVEGLATIRAAVRDFRVPEAPYEIVAATFMEYTFTRLLLLDGALAEARERATLAQRYASLLPLPRAQVAASNAVGLVEIYEGDYANGMARLNGSLERSRSLRASHRDTLVALVMASERSDQPERALEYQRELLWLTLHSMKADVKAHNAVLKTEAINESTRWGIEGVAKLRLERLTVEAAIHEETVLRLETLERMAVATSMREDPTGGHPYRVARLASLVAANTGMGAVECRAIDIAARLHDLGNLVIPDRILHAQRLLTPEERELVHGHTSFGGELLDLYPLSEIVLAKSIAISHHERWDGAGYPSGLAGDEIPIEARITAIAEAFDGMTHRRPHRPALRFEEAMSIIECDSGSKFDPSLTKSFVTVIQSLACSGPRLDALLGGGAYGSRYLRSRSELSKLSTTNPVL